MHDNSSYQPPDMGLGAFESVLRVSFHTQHLVSLQRSKVTALSVPFQCTKPPCLVAGSWNIKEQLVTHSINYSNSGHTAKCTGYIKFMSDGGEVDSTHEVTLSRETA